ncbi:sulfatase [Rubritalea spongiae]|uniref:Sulfatase n=1 Tax=Rubritalea spongiae TaxID=430797 RepID=A0ABW5EA77_9BACT
MAAKPNVVLFFIDDLGWADIGVNGSTFHETPHIDALAKSGVNFTHSYSAHPVCSPTRAALMTGKAPQRVGITQWIPTNAKVALPLSEVTIGEAFQDAGYRTGYIGKWHLGKADDVQPQHQGFDYTVAVNRAGQPASFFYPFGKRKGGSSVPDLENYKKGDYLTDALTDLAIDFIDQKSSEPFFLCLSHYAVHTPIQAPADLVKKYQAKKEKMYGAGKAELLEERYGTMSTARQEDPAYAAMMENLDTNIGRVMEALKASGQLENTIVVFSSDNGGLAHRKQTGGPTSNLPLRSGKAWTYEGGIRIPTIISWEGKIAPQESKTPVITMDIYPTLLELCGLNARPEQHLDGLSLKKVLEGESDAALDRPFLAWTYPHVHGGGHKPSAAIQMKGWKLIKFSDGKTYELYKLTDDLGEKSDLSDQNPERVREMDALLEKWISDTTPKSTK